MSTGSRSTASREDLRPEREVQVPLSEASHAITRTGPKVENQHWADTLIDGTRVVIRPIERSDAQRERDFIKSLSPESRRYRFLGSIGEPSDKLIGQLTDIDHDRDVAFVALVHHSGTEREIGVSRFNIRPDDTSCECAVAVADDWQRRGLGTVLMRHLIAVARSHGLHTMVSYDSAENTGMHALAEFLGFRCEADPDDATQVIYSLTL